MELSSAYRLKATQHWGSNMIGKRILWAAIEDYVGLWEISWEFGKDAEKPSTADLTEILSQYIDQGYVELFHCKEPYGELEKIETNPKAILAESSNWKEPREGAVSIRVSATEKGQDYYKSLA